MGDLSWGVVFGCVMAIGVITLLCSFKSGTWDDGYRQCDKEILLKLTREQRMELHPGLLKND